MIHIATIQDAEQLEILNNEFNGAGETTLEHIRSSLADNKQEVIVVDDLNGELTGFVCVPQHRRKGIASAMIVFAEEYCKSHYPLHKFELLTGTENDGAQSVYAKLGYSEDGELHLAKRFTSK